MQIRVTFGALAAATAVCLAAACAGETTAPGESAPRIGGPSFTASVPSPGEADSVQSGYGSGSTGGFEYEIFEYEPETGTEYVATPDTNATSKGLTSTGGKP